MDAIADGEFPAHADIHRVAVQSVVPRDSEESGGGVAGKSEIASRGEIAEREFAFACEDLCDDRRDDCPCALAGAVGIKRTHDFHRQPERAVVADRELVGGDLRRRIRRLADGGVLFINRDVLRRAVSFARGSDEDVRRLERPARLEDVVSPVHICADIRLRRDVRIRDADERREVENRLATLGGCQHRIVVANIACDDFQLFVNRRAFQPAVKIPRVVVDECTYLEASLHASLDEVRTDEAAGSGDEDFGVLIHGDG